MTDQAPKSAAEEFAELQKEVALQRRAIERLLDERVAAPDYTETLGKMMRDLKDTSKNLTWLVNRPSMLATPEALAGQIVKAGEHARKQDRETVMEAARTLTQATRDIREHIARAREAGLQNRLMRQVGLTATSAGVVIGLLMAIGILHLVPEHGAAWILGSGRWDAGQRLMKSSNASRWRETLWGSELYQSNREAINACRSEVDHARTSKICHLTLKVTREPTVPN